MEDTSERAQIYHRLHVIMSETNNVEFTCIMQQFMSYLVSSHPEFATYFRSYYLKRVEKWAFYHQIRTLVNTNMHTEAFHRVLKYVYLNGKNNRRIDHLLHILLKISRLHMFTMQEVTFILQFHLLLLNNLKYNIVLIAFNKYSLVRSAFLRRKGLVRFAE